MSLVAAKSIYISNLEKIFRDIKNDDDFSEKLSKETADFIKKGDITTVDAGTIPGGAFTGTGKGIIDVNHSTCKQIIYTATQVMKSMVAGGDKYLADNIALGINTMVMIEGKAKIDVTGVVVNPSGVSSPIKGNAKGKFIDNGLSTVLATEIFVIFQAMSKMTEGGDKFFAEGMGNVVTHYLSGGTITTQGKLVLIGSIGNGKIT